jgi:hypothetical protein
VNLREHGSYKKTKKNIHNLPVCDPDIGIIMFLNWQIQRYMSMKNQLWKLFSVASIGDIV